MCILVDSLFGTVNFIRKQHIFAQLTTKRTIYYCKR